MTLVDDIRDNDQTKPLKESIIASAYIWKIKDTSLERPLRKMFIWKRHCHAIREMNDEWYFPVQDEVKKYNEWWFLTSKMRYVDRYEAMNIAIEFWQLLKPEKCEKDTPLFSEDLR